MTPDTILDRLEISAEPFALCELQGACRLGLGRDAGATVHYVLSGTGRFSVAGGPSWPLSPGTLVFVPAGQSHSLHNDGAPAGHTMECEAAELRLARLVARGTGGSRMLAICGHVTLGLRGTYGLIDLVPAPVAVDVAEAPALQDGTAGLLRELASPAPGGRAMIRALLLQCVISMLRTRPEALRFLPLFADPRLAQALHLMLADPGAPHTIETLAEAAGMSRSRFALRFTQTTGTAPAAFLRDLRLARAASLLAAGDMPVDRVAARMGFASRSAFSRAFSARFGHPPASLRQKAR